MGQVSDAFTSQNAYRVGCGRRNSHQWTSLIRLAYSLAPKGNRNLPQRRNFERAVLPHQRPPKQQTGKCPADGIPAGHIRKSQFVIAAGSADRPNTNAALPSAALGWRLPQPSGLGCSAAAWGKPELVGAVDQRELLSMTTPRLTGGSKCVWPLRAARTRLDDRWARLGLVRLPSPTCLRFGRVAA